MLLSIERRSADWFATPTASAGTPVLLDGRTFKAARELHKDDVLSIGDAQIIVLDDSRTRLRLDVQHLVGNHTIPPVVTVTAVDTDNADEDVEIRVTPSGFGARAADAVLTAERTRQSTAPRKPLPKVAIAAVAGVLALLALITLLLSMLQSVEVDVRPDDASISTPGTLFSFRSGDSLRMLAGSHVVRAERERVTPRLK